jgi:hypothetical protein
MAEHERRAATAAVGPKAKWSGFSKNIYADSMGWDVLGEVAIILFWSSQGGSTSQSNVSAGGGLRVGGIGAFLRPSADVDIYTYVQ